MEAIKFVMFYGLEIVVVGLVGVTVLAGLYQVARDKIRSRVTTPAPETAKR